MLCTGPAAGEVMPHSYHTCRGRGGAGEGVGLHVSPGGDALISAPLAI